MYPGYKLLGEVPVSTKYESQDPLLSVAIFNFEELLS